MPWESIKNVGGWFSLIAFIVAAIFSYLRYRAKAQSEMLRSLPDRDKIKIVDKVIGRFDVNTENLTNEQQYNLAMTQIQLAQSRYQGLLWLAGIATTLLMSIWGASLVISKNNLVNSSPSPTPLLADMSNKPMQSPTPRPSSTESVAITSSTIKAPVPTQLPTQATSAMPLKTTEEYFNLGMGHMNKKEWQEAASSFKAALQLQPNDFELCRLLGGALLNLREYDQSIQAYNKAIQINPANEWGYIDRGNVYFARRNYTLAINDYSVAIEKNDKNGWGYFNRMRAYEGLGDTSKAQADCLNAHRVDPKLPPC